MPEYFTRPPRIQPELPSGEQQLPMPPAPQGDRQSLAQLGLPIITILGYVLVSGGRGGSSLLFVLPMALSVMASTFLAFSQMRRTRKVDAEKQAVYTERLTDLRKELIAAHDKQREFYTYNHPDPAST